MGLLVLIIGLIVLLGAHVFVTFRDARAALIARLGTQRLSRAVLDRRDCRSGAGRLGLRQYRAHEWIQIWSPPAFMRHITVLLMLFAVDLFGRRFYAEPHQDAAQASDAGQREDLGARASAGERRSRLDPAVRLVPGLGRLCPHRRQEARRHRRRPQRRPAGPTTRSWSWSASSSILRSASPSILT